MERRIVKEREGTNPGVDGARRRCKTSVHAPWAEDEGRNGDQTAVAESAFFQRLSTPSPGDVRSSLFLKHFELDPEWSGERGEAGRELARGAREDDAFRETGSAGVPRAKIDGNVGCRARLKIAAVLVWNLGGVWKRLLQ
jgi:hypothetical protein